MLRLLTAVALALPLAAPALADVADATPGGFLIRHEASIGASPETVWKALIDIGSWWNPAHSYSNDASNLSLDPRAGGCWCEKLKGGGVVVHMTVVNVAPNSLLRVTGGLGPLQASGLAGSMTWKITPVGTGSKLEMTYSVGGYMQGGLEKIAMPVDNVTGEGVARLKSLLETGKPTAPK